MDATIDLEERHSCIKDICDIDRLKKMDLAQKTKSVGGIFGDEKLKFYHGNLNRKRRQVYIRDIMVDGALIMEPTHVKYGFFDYFQVKFIHFRRVWYALQ